LSRGSTNSIAITMKTTLSLILLVFISTFSKGQLCHYSVSALTATNAPYSIASADFNNDGKMDIVAGASNRIHIYLGNGLGAFTTSSISLPGIVISICTGDYNGDSNKDFIYLTQAGNAFVALGSGTGTFTLGGGYPGCSLPLAVLTEDFTNDNIQDLIVLDGCSPAFHRYIGNGNGTFATASSSILIMNGGNHSTGGVTGYFNADNNKDLIICNAYSNNIAVYLGTGTGSFAPAVHYTVGTRPMGITTADFNNDGHLDIATANEDADSAAVLLGNGAGVFGSAVFYKVGINPLSISAKDLNGDGNIDLAVANYTSNNVAILQGNSAGLFQSAVYYTVGSLPNGIVLSDFNGDTKPDIATSNRFGNSVSLWLSSYPSPMIIGSNTVCQGGSLTLSATALGTNSFTWSTAATGNVINISPVSNTVITVSATSSMGCTETKNFSITTLNIPTLTVNSSSNTICRGQSVTLTVSGASSYSWSVGATNSVIVASPQSNAIYTVTGLGTNGCAGKSVFTQSVSACTDIQQYNNEINDIIVYPNPSNGVFNLSGVSKYENIEIEVYNVIGEKILSQNLKNETSINLSKQSSGIYLLYLKQNEKVIKQGKLILN